MREGRAVHENKQLGDNSRSNNARWNFVRKFEARVFVARIIWNTETHVIANEIIARPSSHVWKYIDLRC